MLYLYLSSDSIKDIISYLTIKAVTENVERFLLLQDSKVSDKFVCNVRLPKSRQNDGDWTTWNKPFRKLKLHLQYALDSVVFKVSAYIPPSISVTHPTWRTLSTISLELRRHSEYHAQIMLQSALQMVWQAREVMYFDSLYIAGILASSLHSVNRFQESLHCYQWLENARTELLGRQHYSTLGAVLGIARNYDSLNNSAGAVSLMWKAYEGRQKKLGDNNYYTINAKSYLVNILLEQDRYGEALELMLRSNDDGLTLYFNLNPCHFAEQSDPFDYMTAQGVHVTFHLPDYLQNLDSTTEAAVCNLYSLFTNLVKLFGSSPWGIHVFQMLKTKALEADNQEIYLAFYIGYLDYMEAVGPGYGFDNWGLELEYTLESIFNRLWIIKTKTPAIQQAILSLAVREYKFLTTFWGECDARTIFASLFIAKEYTIGHKPEIGLRWLRQAELCVPRYTGQDTSLALLNRHLIGDMLYLFGYFEEGLHHISYFDHPEIVYFDQRTDEYSTRPKPPWVDPLIGMGLQYLSLFDKAVPYLIQPSKDSIHYTNEWVQCILVDGLIIRDHARCFSSPTGEPGFHPYLDEYDFTTRVEHFFPLEGIENSYQSWILFGKLWNVTIAEG
jgi:hypothetical protein